MDRTDDNVPEPPEDPTDVGETSSWVNETWNEHGLSDRCYLQGQGQVPTGHGELVRKTVDQSCQNVKNLFGVPEKLDDDPDLVPGSKPASEHLGEAARDAVSFDGTTATTHHGVASSVRVADAEPVVPSDSTASPAARWALAAAMLIVPATFVLYRRLTRDELMDNELRRTVYEALQDEPGRTAAEIAEAEDVNYNTAQYHLERLEEFDEIVGRRDGHRTRYFVNHGRHGHLEKRILSQVADDSRRRILETLAVDGPLRSGDVADRVDLAASTASYHLSRLADDDLVERERDENEVHYAVEDRIAALVERLT